MYRKVERQKGIKKTENTLLEKVKRGLKNIRNSNTKRAVTRMWHQNQKTRAKERKKKKSRIDKENMEFDELNKNDRNKIYNNSKVQETLKPEMTTNRKYTKE